MRDVLSQLAEGGLIDLPTAERARSAWHSGTPLEEAVLQADGLTEERLLPALAEVMGLPFVDLDENPPDKALLAELPARLLTTYQLVPLSRENGRVRIATSRVFDRRGLDELRLATGCALEPVIATGDAIRRALAMHLGVGAATVQSLLAADGIEVVTQDGEDVDLSEVAEDASIIQLVNQVLIEAIERRATDVHFEPFEHKLKVRYRIDGSLVEASIPREVARFQPAIVSRIKILSHLDIAEKRLPQDGRIKLRVSGREIDVRVSIIPMLYGEAVVLRILDRGGALVGLEGLGMSAGHLTQFEEVLSLPHGIVLVTGPTGSGKTTTLYAGLSRINTTDRKIVTIEDPIEYHLDGVNQIQVDTKTGLTFARGLRSILRHDPDVVLIGEIRDRETADIAVQASLTGHLVFSTLHTNDAPGAIPRLIDMGVEPYLVASSLEMVVAQRLVRLICPRCREPMPEADARVLIDRYNGNLPKELFVGRGCRACNGTGYQGRRGVFEMMPMTEQLRALATGTASAREVRKSAVMEGMHSLREDGWRLVREGLTTVQEVLRVTKDEQHVYGETKGKG
jgi:general secretion pathway protein E/type IV pilus assembly protein PilB